MRAKALASEVGQRMAARDKLLADTGLVTIKTKEEQALADAQDAAARAGPAALNAAVPMPIPVEAPRADAPGTTGYGPQQGIVSPEAQKMRDAQIATNNALWPLIVRSGANPTQLIEGVGKGEGLSALSGGLVPGSRPDPNVQRVAGGLYTGTAPTTSTVWSPNDTAGVDASAREKILQDRAKPPEPKMFGDMPYLINPDGSIRPAQGFVPTPKSPERATDPQGNIIERDPTTGVWAPAKGVNPADPTPPKITMIGDNPYLESADGTLTPAKGYTPQPKIINVSEKETPTTMVDGKLKTIPTDIPPPPAPPPFQGKTDKADALNRIEAIRQKLARGETLNRDQAGLYETDLNLAYGPTNEKIIDPATGKTINNQIQPKIPDNIPSVNDVRASAGLPLLPPPPPEPRQNARGPTQDEGQMQRYTPQLVASTQKLDTLKPEQIPNTLIQQITGVRGNDPTFLQSVLASTNFVSPQQRNFAQAVAEYNQSLLYMLSGKAITSDEYKRALTSYIPQPNDDANLLATKADARHAIIATAVRLGWANDPDTGKIVRDNIKAGGIDLDKYDLTIPRLAPSSDGSAPRRQTYDAQGNLR